MAYIQEQVLVQVPVDHIAARHKESLERESERTSAVYAAEQLHGHDVYVEADCALRQAGGGQFGAIGRERRVSGT